MTNDTNRPSIEQARKLAAPPMAAFIDRLIASDRLDATDIAVVRVAARTTEIAPDGGIHVHVARGRGCIPNLMLADEEGALVEERDYSMPTDGSIPRYPLTSVQWVPFATEGAAGWLIERMGGIDLMPYGAEEEIRLMWAALRDRGITFMNTSRPITPFADPGTIPLRLRFDGKPCGEVQFIAEDNINDQHGWEVRVTGHFATGKWLSSYSSREVAVAAAMQHIGEMVGWRPMETG